MADEQKSGEPQADGPVQRYRFKVRTADGRELTSAVAAVKLPPGLQAPQWHKSELSPGEEATMKLKAPGRDGQVINFIVERRKGDGWEPIGHTSGKVDRGEVEVRFETPAIPPDGDADADQQVFYHAPPQPGGDTAAPAGGAAEPAK